MTDFQSDFTPEGMVLWALDMAKESARQMTQEDRLIVIRSVVKAFVDNSVIDDLDLEDEEGSFRAAAQMLYTCGLVTIVFAQAYNHTEDHLKNIEQLRRSFEL